MKVSEVVFLPIDRDLFSYLEEQHGINRQMYPGSAAVTYFRLPKGGLDLTSRQAEVRYVASGQGSAWFPFRLMRAIRRSQPDIIFVHSFIFPLQTFLLRHLYAGKARIVVQHHAEHPRRNFLTAYFQRLAYRHCDAYLFASRPQAEIFVERRLVTMDRVYEVMEGSTLFALKDKALCREQLGLDAGRLFLWVGRLNTNKDPLLVLAAFSEYCQQGGAGNFYMIYQTDELLEAVNAFIASAGLERRVKLIGKVEHNQLETWYNAADFFLLGSHYEGSGYALCEAMACGCIPIVTRIASFQRMTEEGRIGLLFEPGNKEALVGCLKKSDAIPVQEQRIQVRAVFEERLSFPAIAQAIEHIFRNIITRTGS